MLKHKKSTWFINRLSFLTPMHYQPTRVLCNSSFALTIFGVMNSTVQQKWQKRSLGFHWMCPNSGIASSKGRKDRDAQKLLAVKLDALLYDVLLLSPSNHYSSSYMYLGQDCLTQMEKIFVLYHFFYLNGENYNVSVVKWTRHLNLHNICRLTVM